MTGAGEVSLILGGHSFIQQLGSDPAATGEEQVEIVRACLDRGVRWFDTTYQPERVALGKAMAKLGRRAEAHIIAWNFFVDFGPGGEVGGPDYYRPEHLQIMLDQLQTDYIDGLVVHAWKDEKENRRQEELAVSWRDAGHVKWLGTWHPGADAAEKFGRANPYSFMVRPWNVTTRDAGEAFAACRKLGWQTFACSPFVRGWELDKMVKKAMKQRGGEEAAVREELADRMLRYSLYRPNVDRLIVAMRKAQWVGRNVESARKGPLSEQETAWLEELAGKPA